MKTMKQGHRISLNSGFKANILTSIGPLQTFGCSESKMDGRLVKVTVLSFCTYSKVGNGQQHTKPFWQMQQQGVKADKQTLMTVLKECSKFRAIERGKQIHFDMIAIGVKPDVFLGNTLLNMYGQCSELDDARRIFDGIVERNRVSWTVMITAYARHGNAEETLALYWQMQLDNVTPNEVIFVCVINACTSLSALKQDKQIHANVINGGLESNTIISSSLINMYAKHGSLVDAHRIFVSIPERNVVTWTAMITGYSQHGPAEEAIKLFWQMQEEGTKPDEVTFMSTLKACASLGALDPGRRIHVHIIETGLPSASLSNTLVHMYAKCGSLVTARQVFDGIHKKDVASWTVMIEGYNQNGGAESALDLFRQMERELVKPNKVTFISILNACASLALLREGQQIHHRIIRCGFASDIFVGSALVDMYAKCGRIQDAHQVFDNLHKQDVVLWTAIITGYSQQGHSEQALELFQKMQLNGAKPNEVTFVSVLNACACLVALREGRQIHVQICRNGLDCNISIATALIDLYAKCGRLEDACLVLDIMPVQNPIAWTAMIAGYAQHGQGKEALKLLYRMQQENMNLDNISFIGILSACSNAGLVDEGSHYFESMILEYGLIPKAHHYACMVDILGRAGRLEEAEILINRMPFQPNAIVWRALLGACRNHGNMNLAQHAAEHILEMEPQNAPAFVLLSNIYGAAGNWYENDDGAKGE